jgi:small subunit ribosomal protein S8
MSTDSIADFLTRIRNAARVRQRIVDIPSSKVKVAIAEVLKDQGYILNYKVVENGPKRTLKIALKYDLQTKQAAFSQLVRVSKPGLRKYAPASEIPRVMNGLGIAIMSTSKGIMTGKKAKSLNVGGEILCYVY